MRAAVGRWVWGGAVLLGLIAVSVLLLRFPWGTTWQTLAAVNTGLLALALLINLLSPLAKGYRTRKGKNASTKFIIKRRTK